MCCMSTLSLRRVPDPDDLVTSVSRTIPNSGLGTIVRRTIGNFNASSIPRNFSSVIDREDTTVKLGSARRGQMHDCGFP